jgi:hypothetical protein
MEYAVVVAVLAVMLLFRRPGSGLTRGERKLFVAKEIDELAGTAVVSGWKETDDLINLFTGTFKEVGYAAAAEAGEAADAIKVVIDWFMNIIQAGNRHYLAIDKTELKRFGNVLALGTKPLTAGLVFRMTLVRGVDASRTNGFIEKTRREGLPFGIYNLAGQRLTGGLAAGVYFVYARFASDTAAALLPGFVTSALATGEAASDYWTEALRTPAVIIVDKESLIARIDP